MADDKRSYTVLKEATTTEQVAAALEKKARVWVEVGAVPADDNKEAIVAVTKDWTEEAKRGNYAAPSSRNFPVIPRDLTTKVVDEFGEPSTAGTRKPRASKPKAPAGAAA